MKHEIEFLGIEECIDSNFVKAKSMLYIQNGVKKRWDFVKSHDSVAILLYHKDRDSFVFVKQFRPTIFLRNQDGFTYELCAGLVDKEMSLKQIAKEEIEEEVGFSVPMDKIKKITSFYTAVGFAGGKQTLYHASLDDSMKISEGGGIDNEFIEVVYIPKDEVLSFMENEEIVKTSGLMFALMWWFANQ